MRCGALEGVHGHLVKKKRHGKVVIRQGNRVWVAKVTCPTTGPSPAAQSEAVKVLALPPR